SAESYELVPRFDEVAEAAGDERVRRELMTSVLETATGIHTHVAEAMAEVREIRGLLRDAAAERRALIASAGTRPLSRWAPPELLALSANAPYWQARDTGLASTRSKVFETMPRSGLPPALRSFDEFTELVARGTSAGFFDDYTYLWWDVRPHPKLGTVELRAFDAQTRLESVAALAALGQSLAATYAERPVAPQPRALIAENKWRAARYGLD